MAAESAPQGSEEWYAMRCGKITASRMCDVFGTKGARETYMWDLVTERVTQVPHNPPPVAAMEWGNQHEPEARALYALHRDENIVTLSEFIPHSMFKYVGGSPDGLVGDKGGVEIKCPHKSRIHLQYCYDAVPKRYMFQMQALMWITGREWWDFVSFDPRMPEPYNFHCRRIKADAVLHGQMEEKCRDLNTQIDTVISQINAMQTSKDAN